MNTEVHTHTLYVRASDKKLTATYGDRVVKLKLRWWHRFVSREWLLARTAQKAIKRHDRSIDQTDRNTRLQARLTAVQARLQPPPTEQEAMRQRVLAEQMRTATIWHTRNFVNDALYRTWWGSGSTKPEKAWTPMLDAVGFTVEQTIAKTETSKFDWRYTLSKLDAAKDRLRIVGTPSLRDGDSFKVLSRGGTEFGQVNLSSEMIKRASTGYTPGIKEELAYQVEKLPGISEYLVSSLVIG